jgi:protein-L-isoaspartate(D-aspartate) O-methyltransferase
MNNQYLIEKIKCFGLLIFLLIPLALSSIIFLTCLSLKSGLIFASEGNPGRLADTEIKDPNKTESLRPYHKHPAFNEQIDKRKEMVAAQIKARDVNDPNVLKAMQIVPRHAFVQPSEKQNAYDDSPLPIGYEQTISQPYIVAFMTQALRLKADSKVLEIGTGSGYQAAVCAEIAKKVYSIEIVEPLAKIAKERLKELGYPNVIVKLGDGYFGWKENAPYDAIIGTSATENIPEPLLEQLSPDGRMILPYGSAQGLQYLVLIAKDSKGGIHKSILIPVRFVPMTGQATKPDKK